MKPFSSFTQSKQTELFNKYGVFFAFSQKQFEEQKKPDTKYVSLDGGMIAPKDSYRKFLKEFENTMVKAKIEYLKQYSKKDIIWFELANHEAGYTMSWSSTFEAVEYLGITKEEVQGEFREWLRYQVDNDNI